MSLVDDTCDNCGGRFDPMGDPLLSKHPEVGPYAVFCATCEDDPQPPATARNLRADQVDLWREAYRMGAEAGAAAAAENARRAEQLQAAVEALADEWAEDYPGPTAACNRTPDEWARDLRALLAGGAR